MKTENIFLLGGIALVTYLVYKSNKKNKKIIDVDPNYADVKKFDTTKKEVVNPISDEPTLVDTKNKTIVLDLNKGKESKELDLNKGKESNNFSQVIPQDIFKEYNTSKEDTIMKKRIGVKII